MLPDPSTLGCQPCSSAGHEGWELVLTFHWKHLQRLPPLLPPEAELRGLGPLFLLHGLALWLQLQPCGCSQCSWLGWSLQPFLSHC